MAAGAFHTAPISGRLARDMRNDGGQDQEEQGVRRNLKIEIEQAVNEQREHPARRPQCRPALAARLEHVVNE